MGPRNKIYYSFISTFLLVMLTMVSHAQSTYYWTQNFNTESSLLAGAVVGGRAGPSAVYYNPALINQDETNKFALSANLLSFKSMDLENLAGAGTEFDDFILQFQPKFLSYAGAPKNNSKLTYEFAFLVPLHIDVEYTYIQHDTLDIIKRLDGNEDYLGEIFYKNEYDDYYIGGGLSYKLSDRFTIGASLFVSYKQMYYITNLFTKAMQDTDTVYSNGVAEPFYFAQKTYTEELIYLDISLVLKLGVHYKSHNGNWGIGLNFTLPNLSIYGQGDVKKEYYRSNVYDDSEEQFTKDLAFANLQEDVRTKIKDPFSVAFGIQYITPNRKNSFLFSTEYFLAIDPYAMLKTTNTNVIGNLQLENVADVMNYNTSANAVLNVAVGFVQYISDKLTINGGFKTDFNSLTGNKQKMIGTPDIQPALSYLYFNKFHIIVGPSLSVKKFGFVLGIQYTWGRESDLYYMANLSDPVEYIPETKQSLQGSRQNNMKLSYNEISIFFGITYGIGQ